MGTRAATQLRSDVPLSDQRNVTRWSLPILILFRFAFVYLGLYSLVPIDMAAERTFHDHLLFPSIERFWVMLSVWTATHLLRATDFNPHYLGSDSVVSWARLLLLVLIALATTAVWSIADRRRTSYPKLNEWLRLIIRVSLGLTMVNYGIEKAMVVQMAPISPHQLTAPWVSSHVGNFCGRSWAHLRATRHSRV